MKLLQMSSLILSGHVSSCQMLNRPGHEMLPVLSPFLMQHQPLLGCLLSVTLLANALFLGSSQESIHPLKIY